MISSCTSTIRKDDVIFPRLLHSDLRCSQMLPGLLSVLRGLSTVLPDLLSVLPGLLSVLPGFSLTLPGAPRLVSVLPDLSPAPPGAPQVLSSAPRCSQTYDNNSQGTPVPVIRDPSYSDSWPECPPRVCYSPEIHASKFTLHILSDTPGGSQ